MKASRGRRHGIAAPDLPGAAATRLLRTFLEFGGLLGSARRVPGAIGMRPGARELSFVDDQILVADRPALEIALEDFARASRVARLCGKRCPGDMGCHPMVRHGAPRMIVRRRL